MRMGCGWDGVGCVWYAAEVGWDADGMRLGCGWKGDAMVIEIRKEDLPKTRAAKFFIDDIAIKIK